MQDRKSEAKIIEQVSQADNILIAINNSPSVDQLAAALGLTLALNKNGKRATTIFSGKIPNPIKFLKPEQSFDKDVNGLRDFIVALDTNKADFVKTKVVDDMVRISITPAKKAISVDDLEFTQGEYNVDLVLALGVDNKKNLDQTLANHGKILHDAFVASISVDQDNSQLGTVNWQEPTISSYSQISYNLLDNMSILEEDQESEEEFEDWIDQAVATALMTGLVEVTDRFSNEKTSAELMKAAGNLMAKGVDQQMIATELEKAKQSSVKKEVKTEKGQVKKAIKKEVKQESKEAEAKLKIESDPKVKAEQELDKIIAGDKTEVVEDISKEEAKEILADKKQPTEKPAEDDSKTVDESLDLTKKLELAEQKIAEKKAQKTAELKKQLLKQKSKDDLDKVETTKSKPINESEIEDSENSVVEPSKKNEKKSKINFKKVKRVIEPPVHQPGEQENLTAEINKELGIEVPKMPTFNQSAPPAPIAPPVEAPTLAAVPPQQEAANIKQTNQSITSNSQAPLPPPPPMPDFSKMPPMPPQIPNQPVQAPTAPKAKKPEDDEFVIPI